MSTEDQDEIEFSETIPEFDLLNVNEKTNDEDFDFDDLLARLDDAAGTSNTQVKMETSAKVEQVKKASSKNYNNGSNSNYKPRKEKTVHFEEPLDVSQYDECSLLMAVEQKLTKHERAFQEDDDFYEPFPLDKSSFEEYEDQSSLKKRKGIMTITDIQSAIQYEEDEVEISRMEDEERMKQIGNKFSNKTDEEMEEIEEIPVEGGGKEGGPNPNGTEDPSTPAVKKSWVSKKKLPSRYYDELKQTNKLAISYPFDLDEFQQQAVLRLERHETVFIAAHTSAGKTVIAEYGIAMAFRSRKRTVYTSPIKALSNQKYHDFKEKFGAQNVGIITGDLSINPNAQCIIMTTEIFRSMLYKATKLIDEVEFVIFDEVHYVNDIERGVVWEEVIIMLPSTITMIFLSATTPNAADFSDWIGRIKQKNVFLISTNKRPVPLIHYLYYNSEIYKILEGDRNYNYNAISQIKKREIERNRPKPKSAENTIFAAQRKQEKAMLAAQAAGKDYKKAQHIISSYDDKKPGKKYTGTVVKKKGPPGGSKGQWLELIRILKDGGREETNSLHEIVFEGVTCSQAVLSKEARKQKTEQFVKYEKLPKELRAILSKKEYESIEYRDDSSSNKTVEGAGGSGADAVEDEDTGLLPVVVFSFSKKRCEELAEFFKGQDYLNAISKSYVQKLFSSIFSKLKHIDKDLPQINQLKEMLNRGIGIHHGGLLPILKETVELLFANHIIKLLFATETFAMGVNMPTKAVIFNGYHKHDGNSFRMLYTGEYIQMAGRAGRRGLDKYGTVIITAWNSIPSEMTMKTLLIGNPRLLTSQFRLRYNMILNLIKSNNLTILEMIKKSFTEFTIQKQLITYSIGNKLEKYLSFFSYLSSALLYVNSEEKEIKEIITEIEIENRLSYLQQTRNYINKFSIARSLFYEQLLFLKLHCSKEFDFNSFFTFGRLLYFQNEYSGCPRLGMIIANPLRNNKMIKPLTLEALNESSSSLIDRKKKPKVYEKSDLAKTRNSLLNNLPSAPSSSMANMTKQQQLQQQLKEKKDKAAAAKKPPTAPTAATSSGMIVPDKDPLLEELEETFVWVVCLLSSDKDDSDLPQWCIDYTAMTGQLPYDKAILDLNMIYEPKYGKHDLSSYMIIKVAMKDICNVVSPIIDLSSFSSGSSSSSHSSQRSRRGGGGGGGGGNSSSGLEGLGSADGPSRIPTNELLLSLILDGSSLERLLSNSTDFIKDYGISNLSFYEKQNKIITMMSELLVCHRNLLNYSSTIQQNQRHLTEDDNNYYYFNSCYYSLTKIFLKIQYLNKIEKKIDFIKYFISDENLLLFPEFQQKITILKNLGYLQYEKNIAFKAAAGKEGSSTAMVPAPVSTSASSNPTTNMNNYRITRKGLICCEINTCHELLGTEIIFSSLLDPLDPIEAVAILSALIFQEKVDPSSMEGIVDELTPNMEIAKGEIITILYRLNMIEGNDDSSEEGDLLEEVTTNLTSALNNKPVLNFGLCPVIYEWAKGTSFKEITQITTFQEGSIVRTITRLNELCRDFQKAAIQMGNQLLYYKMEEASKCIKRDIVFSGTLY
jgi:superfamily II RNA helicase/uncharacterized membrane protein YgcG